MYSEVKGKKLLILGGNAMWCDIVHAANEMGVYTIVTDWFTDIMRSPAKQIADAHYNIGVNEIEQIVELIEREKINGVLTGYTDVLLPFYIEICSRASLPCYATARQLEVMTNKRIFKDLCIQFGVPVVKDLRFNQVQDLAELGEKVFPVISKPVDNCGARGIKISRNIDELKANYDYALQHSKCKQVIVEKYMGGVKQIDVNYTICDGQYKVTAMFDRIMTYKQKGFASLPVCQLYPSKYLDRYLDEVDKQFVSLLKYVAVDDGFVSLQGFVDNDGFYMYEPAFRLGGAQSYNYTERLYGTSYLKRLINFALTGSMLSDKDSLDLDDPHFRKICATIFVNVHSGIISKIEGLDAISKMPEVIHVLKQHDVGDRIELTGSLLQTCLRIMTTANEREHLAKVVKHINSLLKITSTEGKDMILSRFIYDEQGSTNDLEGYGEG